LAVACAVKLLVELATFRHLRDPRHSAVKRSAILMWEGLGGLTRWRFFCGAAGGVLLPALVHFGVLGWAWPALLLCVLGELLERHLFFASATAPRMPGALA
jgi:hypothetical protein